MPKMDEQKNVVLPQRIIRHHNEPDKIKTLYMRHIVILLNILGLDITLENKGGKRQKWQFILSKCSYYTWKGILTLEIIAAISYCIFSNAEGDIKVILCFAAQRFLRITNTIVILKKRLQFIDILSSINHIRYKKKLKFSTVNWFMGSSALYIFGYITLATVCFMEGSSAYQSNKLHYYFFGANENSIPGILTLHYCISFLFIAVMIVVPAVFTMITVIFSSILKEEFALISDDIIQCITKSTGEKILKDYDKALETGKLIDDTICFPMCTVLSYIMLMMFYHGYRMCFSPNMGTLQVLHYSLFLIFFSKITQCSSVMGIEVDHSSLTRKKIRFCFLLYK